VRPVVPYHLTVAKNRSLCVTIAFSTCAGSRRVTFVLFSEKAKATRRLFAQAPPASAFDRFAARDHVTLYGRGWETISTIIAPPKPHVFREVVYVLSTGARICIGPESVCNRRGHQKRETNLVHKPKTFKARWAKQKGRKIVSIAPKRRISPAGLARIRAAQRARWAKIRGGKK